MTNNDIDALVKLGIIHDDDIDKAKQAIAERNKGTIAIIWTVDDVKWSADDSGLKVTDEQAENILNELKANHDANIGINWDTINYYIDEELSS